MPRVRNAVNQEGEMEEEEQQDFDTEQWEHRWLLHLVQNKNWKERILGYENLTKDLAKCDPEDTIYNAFATSIKNFVGEQNPAALEKGLEAAFIFIATASSSLVGEICADVVAGIIGTCFTARPAAKDKGMEIILLCFELEKQEPTLEKLLEGLSKKSPQVVCGCMHVIRDALRLFGPKIVTLKAILENIPTFLDDRDKSVRAEARALLVEMYRWIGAPIKAQLRSVKPQKMGELEAEFAEHNGVSAVPERLVRSQQVTPVEVPIGSGPTEAEGEPDEAADITMLDWIDPKEILEYLTEDFYNKLRSKNWEEQHKALQMLEKLSQHPKLAAGNYRIIVAELKKVIAEDPHVVLVILAGKCLTNLAQGLRRRFAPYVSACFYVILRKFKEKKSNVVTVMRGTIDACFLSVKLDAVTETVLEGLVHKNPNVRSETALFLTRCFSTFSPEDLSKKQLRVFAEALIKNCNDPDHSVRDCALEALGTAMKVVGEKVMNAFLADDMDELKMKKIRAYCEKAVITPSKRKKAAVPLPAGGSMSVLFSDMLGSSPKKTLAALAALAATFSQEAHLPVYAADDILGLYRHLVELLTRMNTNAMSDYATNASYLTPCYTRAFHAIRAVFDNQQYAHLVDAPLLTSLLYQILPVLLDKRILMMHGCQAIQHLANALVLHIVDNADRTMILCASIRLLRDLMGSGLLADRLVELGTEVVGRCVANMADTVFQLNLDAVLLELHMFLKQFPTRHWPSAVHDTPFRTVHNTPFRTVQTIVHTLTNMLGPQILDHLSLIDDPHMSELVPVLKKMVKAVEVKAGSGAAGDGIVQNGPSEDNGQRRKGRDSGLSSVAGSRQASVSGRTGEEVDVAQEPKGILVMSGKTAQQFTGFKTIDTGARDDAWVVPFPAVSKNGGQASSQSGAV